MDHEGLICGLFIMAITVMVGPTFPPAAPHFRTLNAWEATTSPYMCSLDGGEENHMHQWASGSTPSIPEGGRLIVG